MTPTDALARPLPFTVRWHAAPGGWHWGDVVRIERFRNGVPTAIVRMPDGTEVRKLPKGIVPSAPGVHP